MDNSAKTHPIYFDPEKMGASLKEVGNDYVKVESREIKTRWFRDPTGEVDVFIWMGKDHKIIKQQVSIMGLLTEWNAIEGVKTGVVTEDELTKSEVVKDQLPASELIRFDPVVQAQTLMMSLKLLKGMTGLDEDLKYRVITHFSKHAQKPEFKNATRQSFWKKFFLDLIGKFKA